MKHKPFTPEKLQRQILGQLRMLSAELILGMALNLIGEDSTGVMKTVYLVALALHILIAFGIVGGAITIAVKEKSSLAMWAAVLAGSTLVSGMLTEALKQDVWSFVMACGFLITGWMYGVLYVRVDRQIR
jgi:hypothetical protein